MRQVELDRLVVRPLEAIHPERRTQQAILGRLVVDVRHAEHQQERVDRKRAARRAAGAARPRGSSGRVGPEARAVLGDREVEARVRERHRLGVAVDGAGSRARAPAASARGLELRRRVVDADEPGAAPGQPGADVRRAAAELDRVRAGEVGGQHPHLGLRDPPDPPARAPRPPSSRARPHVFRRPRVPLGGCRHVLRQLGHREAIIQHNAGDRRRKQMPTSRKRPRRSARSTRGSRSSSRTPGTRARPRCSRPSVSRRSRRPAQASRYLGRLDGEVTLDEIVEHTRALADASDLRWRSTSRTATARRRRTPLARSPAPPRRAPSAARSRTGTGTTAFSTS